MKDSKVYAGKIKKLHSALKRAYGKVEPVRYDDPLEALVFGMVSGALTHRQTQTAVKRFADYFIDMNDLRVARTEEVADIAGVDNKAVRSMAQQLSQVLNHIFDQQHTMTLDYLNKLGKRQAKQALQELTGITSFAVDYCLLTALQGHAIPVTTGMVAYLKAEELVHPGAERESIEAFLAKQISAKDNYTFYFLLRTESESSARSRKLKAKTKTKKKKTTKKKIAKKKTKKKAVKKKAVKKRTTR